MSVMPLPIFLMVASLMFVHTSFLQNPESSVLEFENVKHFLSNDPQLATFSGADVRVVKQPWTR